MIAIPGALLIALLVHVGLDCHPRGRRWRSRAGATAALALVLLGGGRRRAFPASVDRSPPPGDGRGHSRRLADLLEQHGGRPAPQPERTSRSRTSGRTTRQGALEPSWTHRFALACPSTCADTSFTSGSCPASWTASGRQKPRLILVHASPSARKPTRPRIGIGSLAAGSSLLHSDYELALEESDRRRSRY